MKFDRDGFYRDVGVRLQFIRKRKGLTQEEVAVGVGVPRATLANVERGRQRVPLDLVWKCAVFLGVSITAMVPEPLSGPSARELSAEIAGSGTSTFTYTLPDE